MGDWERKWINPTGIRGEGAEEVLRTGGRRRRSFTGFSRWNPTPRPSWERVGGKGNQTTRGGGVGGGSGSREGAQGGAPLTARGRGEGAGRTNGAGGTAAGRAGKPVAISPSLHCDLRTG